MKKTFNYKVLNLIKYYSIGIKCNSIRVCLKKIKKKLRSKYLNLKEIFDTLNDFKKMLITNM